MTSSTQLNRNNFNEALYAAVAAPVAGTLLTIGILETDICVEKMNRCVRRGMRETFKFAVDELPKHHPRNIHLENEAYLRYLMTSNPFYKPFGNTGPLIYRTALACGTIYAAKSLTGQPLSDPTTVGIIAGACIGAGAGVRAANRNMFGNFLRFGQLTPPLYHLCIKNIVPAFVAGGSTTYLSLKMQSPKEKES